MDDAPPPRLAPLGRPTLITDLPTDVLSYIISLVPVELPFERYNSLRQRVRLSVVCRAFADAVRPPCAVWTDVSIGLAADKSRLGLREQYNAPNQQGAYGTLERAMQVAGPCVRRFSFDFLYSTLILDEGTHSTRAWVERVLATTPRVHRAKVDRAVAVEGPPPMISAGRAAILDFWTMSRAYPYVPHVDYPGAVLALHRLLVAAGRQPGSVAAPVPVLTSIGRLILAGVSPFSPNPNRDTQLLHPSMRSLLADVGAHLTRLHLSGGALRSPRVVPACVEHLPALRELHVRGWDRDPPPDLRGVVTPPPGLTSLVVQSLAPGTALLPPAIMARLEVLGWCGRVAREPPACLRDAGNSFGRLIRLVYGGEIDHRLVWSADLAWWATPAFAVPTLVVLKVAAPSFTLGAADGPAWAAAVASTTLPRLERLALFQWGVFDRSLSELVYGPAFEGSTLMRADAVAEAITHSLPAAAAAAGRSLSAPVQRVRRLIDGYGAISMLVNPQIELLDAVTCLALKYEARPVR